MVPFVFLQDMKQYQEETLVIRKSTSFYILICLLGFYKVDKCLRLINIIGQHEASQNVIYCYWNNGMVLVQRGALNIRPLPQEMFDFYRYHTSFQITYSLVSSKTSIAGGRVAIPVLSLFQLIFGCRKKTD